MVNLGIAADEMAMTQPAASRMLSEIEQTIGTRLFIRHAKGMEPTLVGQAVARRAHNLLVELRDLAREVGELKRRRRRNHGHRCSNRRRSRLCNSRYPAIANHRPKSRD